MAFVPRSFEQILLDMVNHVRANTTLTDFTVGSVIRTLLEAAALEDDEQYYQMVQLLDVFRIATAVGTDLDERAADLNETRLPAKAAFGKVVITNEGLAKDILSFDGFPADPSVMVDDSTGFPATPPNFDIRVGEGTPQVEDMTITGNDTSTGVLTLLVPLVKDHFSGERVTVLSGSDVVIAPGVQVQVPAQGMNLPIKYSTVETGVIVKGNYESGLIAVRANEVGSSGNAPAGSISQFVSAHPFGGAGVTNPADVVGGRDLETDDQFRDRLLHKYAQLSRGVPEAITQTVIGVEDNNTGQRIVAAKLREDFIIDQHTLFIDDGTGLVPDFVAMGSSTLTAIATSGVTTVLAVIDASGFPSSGLLMLNDANIELVEFSSKGPGNNLNLTAPVAYGHSIGAEVMLVDDLGTATDGQNFFQLRNFPVLRNSYAIFDNGSGTFQRRTDPTDFFLNRTNGELEYVGAGLSAGIKVVANYNYYTGLVQLAQKVLNGDPKDSVNYPGVVAGGIIIHIDVPILRRITVLLGLSILNGFDNATVVSNVIRSVKAYIDNLNIGDSVIRAKIIELAMLVSGVENVIVKMPTEDIIVLEDELPVSFDSNGNSLISVY